MTDPTTPEQAELDRRERFAADVAFWPTPPTIYDDPDTGRLRIEFPPGSGPEHRFVVAGELIAGWVDAMNTYADMRQLQLQRIVLTPVEVFGADCSAHPDSECCTGYGLSDAVGPGWSDCNRAIGRIYRVEDLDSDRFLQDDGKQARVEVWVRRADLPFLDVRHGDFGGDKLLTRIEIGDPTPPVEGTELTPEQLLHRFVTGTPGERIDYLRRMMQLARQADQCVMQNHAGVVDELVPTMRQVVARYHAALEAIGSDPDSTDRIRDAVGRALYPET